MTLATSEQCSLRRSAAREHTPAAGWVARCFEAAEMRRRVSDAASEHLIPVHEGLRRPEGTAFLRAFAGNRPSVLHTCNRATWRISATRPLRGSLSGTTSPRTMARVDSAMPDLKAKIATHQEEILTSVWVHRETSTAYASPSARNTVLCEAPLDFGLTYLGLSAR
jgi:hypothetical protein